MLQQIIHRRKQLHLRLTQAQHQTTLGGTAIAQLIGHLPGTLQDLQAALILGATAHQRRQTLHRLQVVIEDMRPGLHHRQQRLIAAVEVGHQNLQRDPRHRLAHRFHGLRKMQRTAIGQVIACHRRDHHMIEAQPLHRLRHALRFIGLQREGLGGLDRTKPTGPRAALTGNHESGRALAPALPTIGALRLLANRVQLEVRDQGLGAPKHRIPRQFDANPIGFLFPVQGGVNLAGHGLGGRLLTLQPAFAPDNRPMGKNKRLRPVGIPMPPTVFLAALALLGSSLAVAAKPENQRLLSFVNDIQPILTKTGCNAGACHAKAITGQRGFRLSVLGFEPEEDYEAIVKQGRGRRVMPQAPESSLLITKAAALVPHTGGKKVQVGSAEYKTLVNWIAQGMPYRPEGDPDLKRIEVQPARQQLKPQTQLDLTVTAHYSDGSKRDITGLSLFESNDRAMAEVSEQGRVKALDLPGSVAVMVRYGGQAAVSNLSIALDHAVTSVPAQRNFIDQWVFANLKRIGIPPSPICDDSSFLRRVHLDLAGRIPSVEEVDAFLNDKAPDKRDRVIETLLASPECADYFANKWTALLKNKRDDPADITANFAFHAWMRDNLLANTPYDQIVRQILGSTGTIATNPPVAWYKRVKEATTQLEDVAQLFLGVRMQCAQCHHHPFERWSQGDYYHLAAFFSQIGRKPTTVAGEDLIFHKRGIAQTEHRKTRVMLRPAGLGQTPQEIAPDDDPRLALVDWMSSKDNPFFAKSLVNRYWKHFFRRGLIEPEDDIRDTNPPTNPELLEALAKHFTESGYDLRALLRVLVQSHAYQLSSQPNEFNVADTQAYSHYYPRRLTAEVLLDSIDQVAGTQSDFADLPPGTRAVSLPDNSYNRASPFLKVFGRPDNTSVCECERVQSASLAQSLHLMNAPDIKAKLASNSGRAEQLTKAKTAAPQSLRQLYYAAYGRPPDAQELRIAETYLAKPREDNQGKPLDSQRATRMGYEDLIWALINTKEFLYNH